MGKGLRGRKGSEGEEGKRRAGRREGEEVESEEFGAAQLEPGRAAGKQIKPGLQVHPLQVATSGVV